jgi:hypothetical protein
MESSAVTARLLVFLIEGNREIRTSPYGARATAVRMTGEMGSRKPTSRRTIATAGVVVAALLLLAGIGRFVSLQQPVSDAEATALAEQAEDITQLMQNQLAEQLEGQPLNAEQTRLDSPMGQALFRKCLEWTEFHDNHASETTLLNRDDACNEYRGYIATGVEPE